MIRANNGKSEPGSPHSRTGSRCSEAALHFASISRNTELCPIRLSKPFTLKPSLFPITAREKITYKSSNTKIATVNKNGRIVAKKAGTVTIRVTAGKAKARCKVTVKK